LSFNFRILFAYGEIPLEERREEGGIETDDAR
jgi:hypothetical protein